RVVVCVCCVCVCVCVCVCICVCVCGFNPSHRLTCLVCFSSFDITGTNRVCVCVCVCVCVKDTEENTVFGQNIEGYIAHAMGVHACVYVCAPARMCTKK